MVRKLTMKGITLIDLNFNCYNLTQFQCGKVKHDL